MSCRRHARAITLAGLLLTSGCAAWALVRPGEHVVHDYRVSTPVSWSRIERGGDEVWTVDGVRLEELRFLRPVEDGSALFADAPEGSPIFRAHLTPGELVDFVVDSLSRAGLERIEASDLRPAPFGEHEGVRFALDFATRDGLEMRGLGLASVAGEKLYVILYTGTKLHYYDRHAADAERVLDSVRTSVSGG